MTTKLCKHCNTVKPIEELTKDKRSKDGHTSTCKKCVSEKAKAKYDQQKAKQRRDKTKEYMSEYLKKYYLEVTKPNKKKFRLENPIKRQSQAEKAVIKRLNKQKRRAMQKDSDVTYIKQKELLDSAKKCYWCGINFTKYIIKTIDHYVPIAKGGKHSIDNIVVACKSCNSSKQAKAPEDFAIKMGKIF